MLFVQKSQYLQCSVYKNSAGLNSHSKKILSLTEVEDETFCFGLAILLLIASPPPDPNILPFFLILAH